MHHRQFESGQSAPRQDLSDFGGTTKVLLHSIEVAYNPPHPPYPPIHPPTMFLCTRRAPTTLLKQKHILLSTRRNRSSTTNSNVTAATQLSPRWLSDLKQRIGKCLTFGLTPAQTAVAGGILAEVARDWRELLAGSEGYLTSPDRRGLHRWPVAWGELDSMVCSLP